MLDQDTATREIDALREGRAWVDMSGGRTVRVSGSDAIAWLHDLLTADVAGLAPGRATRSLLLTPTGHVRADVHIVRRDEDIVLVQDAGQPEGIGTALEPFVLSADVRLEDITGDIAVFAMPGRTTAPGDLSAIEVSCLGAGIDVIVPSADAAATRDALGSAHLVEVGPQRAEGWRIERGIARMGPDFDRRSLPSEAGLDDLIDATKGCFLGQESVARIRNLGHPPRVLRHVRGEAPLRRGGAVHDGASEVGEVTSATATRDGWIALARVAWSSATARLTDDDGHPLRDVAAPG